MPRFLNTETRRTKRKIRGFTEKILSKPYLFPSLLRIFVAFFQENHNFVDDSDIDSLVEFREIVKQSFLSPAISDLGMVHFVHWELDTFCQVFRRRIVDVQTLGIRITPEQRQYLQYPVSNIHSPTANLSSSKTSLLNHA